MSVLTKLFVVLLVISSLLLSASVVVFVNRAEDHRERADASKKQLGSKLREITELTKAQAEQQSAYAALQSEITRQAGDMSRELVARDTAIQEAKAKVAQLEKDAQIKDATVKGTADALRAANEENKGMMAANAEIRAKNDDLLKQNGELNTEITVRIHKAEQAEKARDYATEQMTDIKAQLASLRQRGGAGGTMTGGADATQAAPGPINGVVRAVDVIGGKKYATISVGSADNVTKGMKFNVVNTKTGEFLGFLTVDSVQPNEAIGQVEGKVDKIQKDVEVKTQL
jgi:hypothetical protein